MARENQDGFDFIGLIARASRLIGMSPVRVRWRLTAYRDRLLARRAGLGTRAAQVTMNNKLCPSCGAINGGTDRVCVTCGARLRSRPAELVARFFRHFAIGLTPETFLATILVAVYAVVSLRGPGSGWLAASSMDLYHLGANFPPVTLQQPWRLLCAVLLHGGLAHLGFNVYALIYIMPFIRAVYGANQAMVVFVVTGIGSSLVSTGWSIFGEMARGHHPGVSIGASGAICGLMGLALVWGHRDGTIAGRETRNAMARWVAYTLLFGFLVGGIDNAGHVGGWLGGGLLALIVPARRGRQHRAWRVASLAAVALLIAAAAFILHQAFLVPFPAPPT